MTESALLQYQKVDNPGLPPTKRGRGRPGDFTLSDLLLRMKIDECVDVNRSVDSVVAAVQRLRKKFDSPIRVVSRTIRPRWTRVWRIE